MDDIAVFRYACMMRSSPDIDAGGSTSACTGRSTLAYSASFVAVWGPRFLSCLVGIVHQRVVANKPLNLQRSDIMWCSVM